MKPSRVTILSGIVRKPAPLALGARRWIHVGSMPNGAFASIPDKGSIGDPAVNEGSLTVSGGTITFNGTNQALNLSVQFSTESDSEFFMAVQTSGVFRVVMSDIQSNSNYFEFGTGTGLTGQTVNVAPVVITRYLADNDVVFTNQEIENTMSILSFIVSGSGYRPGVNGVEGTPVAHAGSVSETKWTADIVGDDVTNIGKRDVSGTDVYFAGVLGKSGLVEMPPLTAQQRADVIGYMMDESL